MTWTVFTGDIVASTRLSKARLDMIMAELHSLTKDISGWPATRRSQTTAGFARRGGDGWQIAVQWLKNPLRVALCAQATVRATSEDATTRIAVATGTGIVTEDLNSAHGPAFTASGRLLETLHDRRLLIHADGGAIDAAFCLADHIAQDWTQAQARALALKLPPDEIANRVIAERIGISRQAVDQALAGAGYAALADALAVLDGLEGDAP